MAEESQSVIVNFAPTGMVPTKTMTPHVPLSVSEIVEDVHAAWEMGITIVHLHARDPATGAPTTSPDVFGELIGGIRAFAPDLVVCASLSGRTVQDLEQRAAPLMLEDDLKPDMGSLTLGSVDFSRQTSVNDLSAIRGLAGRMQTRGVLPELEVFDVGMINTARYLIDRGLLEPPYYFNLFFGNICGVQADLLHAGLMLRDLPEASYWSFAGVGDCHVQMNAMAIAAGGGIRVGIEDSIFYDRKRSRLTRNIELLTRTHRIAEAMERDIMKPAELRHRLRLREGHGNYGRVAGGKVVADNP